VTAVLVEREFPEPVEFDAIQAVEERGAWCLRTHRVTFVRTWFSRDRRRMVCLYEAPDAESVRLAQSKAGMPVTRVWAAVRIPPSPGQAGSEEAGGIGELVVVERSFERPWSLEAIGETFTHVLPCLIRHDVRYGGGFLSQDGRRMICVFHAVDAESVRHSNRSAGIPFDRAWTAALHEPPC
jgi:hypothetical protein